MSENPKLDINSNYNLLDGIKSSPAIDVTESSPNFVGRPKYDKNSNSNAEATGAAGDELAKKVAEMKIVKTRQLLLNYDYFMSPNWDGRHGIYCSCSSSSSDEDYDESDVDESYSEDSDNDSDDDTVSQNFFLKIQAKKLVKSISWNYFLMFKKD